MLLHLGKMPRKVLTGMVTPGSVLSRSMRLFPDLMDPDAMNRRESLRLEAPSVNGVGQPRAMACIYARYAMGFLKPTVGMPFGSSHRAFGAPGGGGALGLADPDAQVGYAYAMNRLGFHMPVDPRELALLEAFNTAIGGPPQR
jgi:CubicO group peptidase (beta-lactamase class C family)